MTCEQELELQQLVDDGELTRHLANQLRLKIGGPTESVRALFEREGLQRTRPTDPGPALDVALVECHEQLTAFQTGTFARTTLLALLMGKVMKATRGHTPPEMVRTAIEQKLDDADWAHLSPLHHGRW